MPTVTYTLTTDQLTAICHALGVTEGLGRSATAQEAKEYGIQVFRDVVKKAAEIEGRRSIVFPDLGEIS